KPTASRSLAASDMLERVGEVMVWLLPEQRKWGWGSGRLVQAEHADGLRQAHRLVFQRLGGGGALFDQRGVLLCHAVVLDDRRVDQAEAVALLGRGGGDLADDVGDALHRADD